MYSRLFKLTSTVAAALILSGQANPAPAQHQAASSVPVPPAMRDHGDHGSTSTVSRDLGTTTADGLTVSTSLESAIDAGQKATFHITIKPATPKPLAVRCWIGMENGAGSIKSKAELEDEAEGMYHGEPEAPWKLDQSSKVWIEIQTSNSRRTRVSFPLKS